MLVSNTFTFRSNAEVIADKCVPSCPFTSCFVSVCIPTNLALVAPLALFSSSLLTHSPCAVVLLHFRSYHQCKYEPGNEVLSGYQLCVLDVLDATHSFTVITQGVCLPGSCNGNAIQEFVRQIITCHGAGLLEEYLSEDCWGINRSVASEILNGTWDIVDR